MFRNSLLQTRSSNIKCWFLSGLSVCSFQCFFAQTGNTSLSFLSVFINVERLWKHQRRCWKPARDFNRPVHNKIWYAELDYRAQTSSPQILDRSSSQLKGNPPKKLQDGHVWTKTAASLKQSIIWATGFRRHRLWNESTVKFEVLHLAETLRPARWLESRGDRIQSHRRASFRKEPPNELRLQNRHHWNDFSAAGSDLLRLTPTYETISWLICREWV